MYPKLDLESDTKGGKGRLSQIFIDCTACESSSSGTESSEGSMLCVSAITNLHSLGLLLSHSLIKK